MLALQQKMRHAPTALEVEDYNQETLPGIKCNASQGFQSLRD